MQWSLLTCSDGIKSGLAWGNPQSYLDCDPLPDTLVRFFGHALRAADDAAVEHLLDSGLEHKLRSCYVSNELRRQAVRASGAQYHEYRNE